MVNLKEEFTEEIGWDVQNLSRKRGIERQSKPKKRTNNSLEFGEREKQRTPFYIQAVYTYNIYVYVQCVFVRDIIHVK